MGKAPTAAEAVRHKVVGAARRGGKFCERSLLIAIGEERVVLAVGGTPHPRGAMWRAAREVGEAPLSFANEQDVSVVAVGVGGECVPVCVELGLDASRGLGGASSSR
jgi:hypothetical protein